MLGQLKGMAHAGCKGMADAFIAAVYMAPVQLRIADIITRFPEENKKGPKPPEYAFIQMYLNHLNMQVILFLLPFYRI